MLRKLLFDLDNTLLDFDKAERLALTKALSALSLEPTDHMLDRYIRSIWHSGSCWKRESLTVKR